MGWQEVLSKAPRGKQDLNRSPCFSTRSYATDTPPSDPPHGSSLPILQMGKTEALSNPGQKKKKKKQGKGPPGSLHKRAQMVCLPLRKFEPCPPAQMSLCCLWPVVAAACRDFGWGQGSRRQRGAGSAKLSPSTERGGSGSLRLPGKSLSPSHAQETWAALNPHSPGPSAFQCASSSSSAALFPLLSPSLFHPRPLPGASPIRAATAKTNTTPTTSR